ncbi:hypothetical protein [Mycolicibacterium sp. XJ1904]
MPVSTTNIAVTAQSGVPPKLNCSAVCCTNSVFGEPPKPSGQMPSEATGLRRRE